MRARGRLSRAAWGIGLAAAFLASGCTSTVEGVPAGSQDQAQPQAPNNPHPAKPRPEDRDPEAVANAITGIDACKLFSGSAAKGTPIPTGPHSCRLGEQETVADQKVVRVNVGVLSEHFDRFRFEPIEIGGAKAYQLQESESKTSECQVVVPISFTRAIGYLYQADSGVKDSCRHIRKTAANGLAKLMKDPDSAALESDSRPFAQWDLCSFLSHALGDDAQHYRLAPAVHKSEASSCSAEPRGEDSSSEIELFAEYASWYEPSTTHHFDGKKAEVRDYSSWCEVGWQQDKTGLSEDQNVEYLVLRAKNRVACNEFLPFVERLVEVAGSDPPASEVEPQVPLLYQPDEPDTEMIGACEHFSASNENGDCEPYHEVDVPEGGSDEIVQAAVKDRNVNCALANEAVTGVYGSELQPLTFRNACYFVEPAHTVEISVITNPNEAPRDWATHGHESCKGTKIREQQVVTCRGNESSYNVIASPHGDISEPGAIAFYAKLRHGRGVDRTTPKPDDAKLKRLDKVVTRVIKAHFR